MAKTLNEFTGRSDKSLRTELAKLDAAWRNVRSGDGHGGSPGEGIIEHIDALEAELRERGDDRTVALILSTSDEDALAGRWPEGV